MADARDAAEAAGKQTADALRADLEAAGVSALRAATEAEASLDAARRRIEALEFKNLELERLRGWKGVFGGAKALSTSSKKTRIRKKRSFRRFRAAKPRSKRWPLACRTLTLA